MIDNQYKFCQAARMSQTARKFIAVLLAIWLPLFSGSALAASISMQMQQGACHEMGMDETQDRGDHQHAMSHDQSPAHDQHGTSCTACGVCHLACSGYLAVQEVRALDTPQVVGPVTPYLFSFHSIISIPLLPPPLPLA